MTSTEQHFGEAGATLQRTLRATTQALHDAEFDSGILAVLTKYLDSGETLDRARARITVILAQEKMKRSTAPVGEGGPQSPAAQSRQRAKPKPRREPLEFGPASLALKTRQALSIMDQHKTSDGRSWGDVKAYELPGMARDGAMAKALQNHLGTLSEDTEKKSIRELMNDETYAAIRGRVNEDT